MKIFYVTDIHGSDVCWRKFLNAGPFYGADVVIVGGDITGKAMVPIVERNGRWETTVQDHHELLETEEEVRAMSGMPTEKVKLARTVAASISQHDFESKMKVVFESLQRCGETAFKP